MSLGTRQSNQGLRTEQAKRMLVRYMWNSNLQAGDRLPSYESLRSELALGDATINRAVRCLEQDGVLETKKRVGTFVVDPEADGHSGWVIGLAALRSGDRQLGPFYSCLLHYLQTCLREVGCQTMVFYQSGTLEDTVSLSDIPGLQRAIDQHEIDSVLLTLNVDKSSWRALEKSNMHPCFVGAPTPADRGIFIDMLEAVHLMVQDLIDRGCRRPALVIPPGSVNGFFLPVFREALKDLEDANPDRLYFTGVSIQGGREIANQIMAINPDDRPDGIAIVDDQIAIGLANHLVRELPAYSPHLACLVNKQVPVDLPFKDISFFEVGTDELAKHTVSMVMKLLRGEKCEHNKIQIVPQKICNTASVFNRVYGKKRRGFVECINE